MVMGAAKQPPADAAAVFLKQTALLRGCPAEVIQKLAQLVEQGQPHEARAGADRQSILQFMTTEHFTLQTARAVKEAGASLLQLYTGLVFEGPKLIGGIKQALVEAMEKAKASSLAPLIGRDADRWADRRL